MVQVRSLWGADEQGGLGGGTSPNKRGYGGGSPQLELQYISAL